MGVSTPWFQADWFDGKTPIRHEARVVPMRDRLLLDLEDGRRLEWKYADTRLIPPQGSGPVRLEHSPEDLPPGSQPATLVIASPDFLKRVYDKDPTAFRRGLDRLIHPSMKRLLIVGAVVLCPLFLVWLWLAVVPNVADLVSANLPASWEKRLGESALEILLEGIPPEPDPETRRALDAITRRLLEPFPEQPYEFKIHIYPSPVVNALALPGGTVVVFQGLINKTRRAEELAGVLAHEFQHVLKRHATRKLIRDATLGIVIALVSGNGDWLEVVLSSAQLLEGLRYSRDLEAEADREGMKMILAARVDPQGMVRMFEILYEEEKKLVEIFSSGPAPEAEDPDAPPPSGKDETPRWLEWLSTHPSGAERLERLRVLAAQATYEPRPILEDFEWTGLHRQLEEME